MSPKSLSRLAVSACLAGLLSAHAAELTGVVQDPSGRSVAGVRVESGAVRTRTDSAGRFLLSGLRPGPASVRAAAEAFEPVVAEVQVAADGSSDIVLQFEYVRSASAAVEVVGAAEDALEAIPGSVFLISREELLDSKPLDANEALRRTPGITLREDSGPMAMRLNVGLRGLNPDRSRKVLMLEDGVPISLAPYGEPEMYYSPPIDRMERVEVLKGSGQIAHGPQTVGGVINFVTPNPPASRFHSDVDVEGGQRGIFNGFASIGGSNRDQSAGWFLSYLHKEGDGWRSFFHDIDDVQAKFTFRPADRHALAFKGGVYDERSNSTYFGLTQPMFDRDPNQNPVPGDDLDVSRESASVSHTYTVSPHAVWSTTGFAYHTIRNWGRQDWDRSDAGRDYLGVAGDPSIPGGAIFLRDSAGNRNREFHVAGIQTGLSFDGDLGGRRNQLDLGLRYIHEKAVDQRINGEGFRARTGVLRDDEDRFGNAFSAYVQNRFHLGERWIVTPGVRLESYRQERHIVRRRVGGVPTNVDIRQDNSITTAVPGLGVSFKASNRITLFSGVHRGFAPPRTKIAITNDGDNLDLNAELSWNYEAGVRVTGSRAVRGELTYFRMDFSNQIITAAESGGATTTLANGGETLHQGLESSLRLQLDQLVDTGGWTLYTDVRHMHLATAKFRGASIYAGNRLPYAPENTFSFLVGGRRRNGLGFQLDMAYVADQFGDNEETVPGSADGTVGRLAGYELFNLMVDYRVERERFTITPYFTVKNLFDELYIASRAPQGIQPGMFRQANVGLRLSF